MSYLMTHLVAHYPSPEQFREALSAMLENNVDYIEIQLPFTNPVADGPLIYQANQKALQYKKSTKETIEFAGQIRAGIQSTSRLLLMSYITPLIAFGLEHMCELMQANGFHGFIVPDLPFGSPEQIQLSSLCEQYHLQLIPVISPLTQLERLEVIKHYLQPDQLIYATARSGKTGNATDLLDPAIQEYFTFLKEHLPGFQIAIGFGIREKAQVEGLNEQGFIAVIGSEIIRRIEDAEGKGESVREKVVSFLLSLA